MKLTANEKVSGAARPSRRLRSSRFVPAGLALLAASLLVPSVALAQDEYDAPAEETAEAVAEEEPAPVVEETAYEETPAPEPVAETAAPAAAGSSFADKIDYMLMASGYYLFSSGLVPGDGDSLGYNAIGYPYTQFPGFGLNFIGGDVTYSDGDFAATLNLRWANGAPLLTPIAPIKQAYVTWAPGDWAFDIGFFDTIYGAEVADEWANINFSRGALYFNRQPFNHLGLRVGGEVSDGIGLNFLVVNGDVGVAGLPAGEFEFSNVTPSFGAQVNISSIENLGIVLGYLTGPNGVAFNGNSDFGHFFDVVLSYSTGALSLVANIDVTVDPNFFEDETATLFGGMVGGSYTLSDSTSVGARYEFLSGSGEEGGVDLDSPFQTITATLRYKPNDYLTFSFEPRVEIADEPTFFSQEDDVPVLEDDTWFGFIFGVSGVISE